MNLREVRQLQKEYGYDNIQSLIDKGLAWHMEGSIGREAMEMLEIGICFLPLKVHRDAYGNRIPKRTELKEGTKGTRLNAINYWKSYGVNNKD